MIDLPQPLTPADCDLRDFQYMELDVRVLRDSRFGAQVSGDAFRAGVMLWCAAWHQVPAGSLKDDDIDLANLAGYGRFAKEWRKVREEALTNFVKCSDGRLYHTEVAKKALGAWNAKLRHHYDRARDRLRKANKARVAAGLAELPEFTFDQWNDLRLSNDIPMEKAEASAGIPPISPPPSAGIPPENALKGNGKGTERERNGDSYSVPDGTGGTPPSPPPPAPPAPKTAKVLTPAEQEKSALWAWFKTRLVEQGTSPDVKAAGMLAGGLAQKYGNDVFLESARVAMTAEPGNLHTYFVGLCETAVGKRPGLKRTTGLSDADRIAANAQADEEAKRLLFGAKSTGEVIDV